MSQLHLLQVATIQIQQWLTDISATRGQDGLNDGFDEADKSVAQFRSSVSQLKVLDTRSGIDYSSLIPVMEVYHQTGIKMANAYIEGGAPAGNKIMAEFDQAASDIYGEIDVIAERLEALQAGAFQKELNATKTSENMIVLFSIIYIVLLSILLWGVKRFVLTPVSNILNMTENLSSGDGDLTQRLTVNGKHELALLAMSFNAFIVKTDDMVSQVTRSVIRLIPMAKELTDTNKEIEDASLIQSEHSRHVSEHIELTKVSAGEVSVLIKEIASAVKSNVTALDDGQHVVRDMIQGMDKLSGEIGLVSEAVTQLREDSKKIESIVDVINAISEQTNLLALNAAIEAARAGEAGRGFAVVADEVRTLANKTKNSTEEIQSMINSIQNGTLQAARTMEKGMESTRSSVDQVHQSAEMLKNLGLSMSEINTQAEKIESETDVQSHHFHSVSENINIMESQFTKTLERLEYNLQFGADLNKLSEKLSSLISKFKVTDSDWSDSKRTQKRDPNQSN
ncbi:methyl-accepting chemotaxis protein [Marinomonas sp. IMCC 4694]|uniref:methyl-accepting chemotaxis protein n=1 Tax=Marinomonas sp. IMCC 4694 TaxID=2605432 RepID=UPI001652E846|nr:methyl-accepting chemotaxis protein [Marinomonas sp. IMCC 4694]